MIFRSSDDSVLKSLMLNSEYFLIGLGLPAFDGRVEADSLFIAEDEAKKTT